MKEIKNIIILTAVLLMICGCESKKEKSQALYREALLAFNKDILQAEILFKEAYELDTMNIAALKGLIQAHIQLKNSDKAVTYYQKYINILYFNDTISFSLAQLLIHQGCIDNAIRLLQNCYSTKCDSMLKQLLVPKIDSIKALPYANVNLNRLYQLINLTYREKGEINSKGIALFKTLQFVEQQRREKSSEYNASLQMIKNEIDSLQVEYDEDLYATAKGYSLANRYGNLDFKNSEELYETCRDLTGNVRGIHSLINFTSNPLSNNYKNLECIFYHTALKRKLESIKGI